MNLYYDMGGRVISLEEWSILFEDKSRFLAKTEVGDVAVSTVWLGLDHSFGGEGDPLIFETMTFGSGDDFQETCIRYSTREDALRGHWKIVLELMGGPCSDEDVNQAIEGTSKIVNDLLANAENLE